MYLVQGMNFVLYIQDRLYELQELYEFYGCMIFMICMSGMISQVVRYHQYDLFYDLVPATGETFWL